MVVEVRSRQTSAQASAYGRHAIVASILSLAANAFGANPATSPPQFSPDREAILQIESIALPPVMLPGDLENEQLTREVFEELTLRLALKGYVLHRVARTTPRPGPNPPSLGDLSADALADLLPDGGTHYLLGWIDKVEGGRGGDANAAASLQVSAALIDRNAKRILWRNTGSQGRVQFPANTPFLTWLAFQHANQPYVPDALRQSEFDRALRESTDLGQRMLDLISPTVVAVRNLLSSFPERPIR